VVGDRAYVGTSDGRVLQVDPEGEVDEGGVGGSAEVTDLVAGSHAIGLLDDDDHFRLLGADDLETIAVAEDRGAALMVGRDGDEDVFTTTALDGRITVYDAGGGVVRHVRAPLTAADGSIGAGAQRPGAVSFDGVVWASAVSGVLRWEAP
jgi:hypothetical protein